MEGVRACMVAVVMLSGLVEGNYKKWTQNTNFENPANWNVGRVPCSQDRLSFPETAPPIFFQTNTTVMDIVLPINGELILGDFVSLGVYDSQDTSCDGQDVEFTGTDPKSWFDTSNWCVTLDPQGACIASQPDLLDSEKVPCKTDGAEFPVGSSFLVDLDTGVDIYISSLMLSGRSYSTGNFRKYLDSPEGKKQFVRADGPNPTTVNIRDDTCDDPTGCACGNDQGALYQKVCEKIEDQCSPVICPDPLRPTGHCCDVCGAVLTMEYTTGFKLTTLKNLIQNNYVQANPSYSNVRDIVSKTSTDTIQVVLTDPSGGDQAAEVGRLLKKDLENDMNGARKYGVTSVRIQQSGSTRPTPAPQTGGKMTGSSIAGIVIAILIIIAIIVLAMFCFMDRRRRPIIASVKSAFPFKRSGKTEDLELGPSVGFQDTMTYSDLTSRGFDNPMYDTVEKSDFQKQQGAQDSIAVINGAAAYPQFSDPSYADGEGFSNPLYGGLEEINQNGTTMIKFNPMYSTEGVEADSHI